LRGRVTLLIRLRTLRFIACGQKQTAEAQRNEADRPREHEFRFHVLGLTIGERIRLTMNYIQVTTTYCLVGISFHRVIRILMQQDVLVSCARSLTEVELIDMTAN